MRLLLVGTKATSSTVMMTAPNSVLFSPFPLAPCTVCLAPVFHLSLGLHLHFLLAQKFP